MLWLKGHDTSRVSAEISACIPAQLQPGVDQMKVPEMKDFIEPSDPQQRVLLRMVLEKQIHACMAVGQKGSCREQGSCKKGFP
jgi:hypothetical protein